MNKIFKDTLILFVITLISGLGLGFVYNVTSDARAKQEEKTMVEAYEAVMPGLSKYDTVDFDSKLNDTISKEIKNTERKMEFPQLRLIMPPLIMLLKQQMIAVMI